MAARYCMINLVASVFPDLLSISTAFIVYYKLYYMYIMILIFYYIILYNILYPLSPEMRIDWSLLYRRRLAYESSAMANKCGGFDPNCCPIYLIFVQILIFLCIKFCYHVYWFIVCASEK